MISNDTLLSTCVTIAFSYFSILVTLLLAKDNNDSSFIQNIIIILTAGCVLFLFIAFLLWFGPTNLLYLVLSKLQTISKMILTIFSIWERTYFKLQDFEYIYLEGLLIFGVIGFVGIYFAFDGFCSVFLKFSYIIIQTIVALNLPYFTGVLIYHWFYNKFTTFVAILLSCLINLFIGALIAIPLFLIFMFFDDFIF